MDFRQEVKQVDKSQRNWISIKPENKEKLVAILTYHVVSERVTTKDVVKLNGAETVNGQRANIVVDDKTVMVDNANVIQTDIKTSNDICERFHKTIHDEFYSTAFRKKVYASIEELQKDLDDWIEEYNTQQTHSGKYCYGKTPMETFVDAKPLAKQKELDSLVQKQAV